MHNFVEFPQSCSKCHEGILKFSSPGILSLETTLVKVLQEERKHKKTPWIPPIWKMIDLYTFSVFIFGECFFWLRKCMWEQTYNVAVPKMTSRLFRKLWGIHAEAMDCRDGTAKKLFNCKFLPLKLQISWAKNWCVACGMRQPTWLTWLSQVARLWRELIDVIIWPIWKP